MTAATGQTRKIGESLMSRKTPALTRRMSSAEVGSRCHHSAEQPGVERHLSRLGDAGERQRHRRQGGKRRSHDAGGDELHERGVPMVSAIANSATKADAASQVHDDLAKRLLIIRRLV